MFAVWTVALWISRIPNALSNDDLSGFEQFLRLGSASAFLVLALPFALFHWHSRWWPLGLARIGLLRVLIAATFGYWSLRALGLFYTGFNFTLTSAHLVMGSVSIVLAFAALVMSVQPVIAKSASRNSARRSSLHELPQRLSS